MILIKHFLETIGNDDGQRLWVEPVGLCRDLKEWCRVDHVLTEIAPPRQLWDWFQKHPDGYDFFRAKYHEHLQATPFREVLMKLAQSASRSNFTLLHQGDLPDRNTATALYEFLSELQAYCK
jgi:uncharacterized protein YeaO (DUF488 family)